MVMLNFISNLLFNYQHKTQLDALEEATKILESDSKKLKISTQELSQTASNLTVLLERKLQLSEKKFNLVENYIDDIVIVKTSNKRIININDFACDVFDVERECCIGKTIDEVMECYPRLQSVLEKFKTNEEKSFEHNIAVNFDVDVEKDGEKLTLNISVNPVESDDNEEKELIIVGHNKESIKELSPSEILFNSMPEPIIALTKDFKVYFANKKLQEKFGISYKEVRRKGLSSVVPHELASKIIEKIKSGTSIKPVRINKTIVCNTIFENDSPKFYILKFN